MTDGSEEAITRLALAAKAGDRQAAAEFIRLTQPGLLRFLTVLAERGDVEDLAQETYLRAMPALARFDARSSARTWLYAIGRRVAVDHVRHAQRRPRTSPLEHLDESRQRVPSQFDEAVALHDLLRGLPPDRREAFALTQLLGLSYEEAAQVCDCPVGTIRSRVSRARDDLITATTGGQDRTARSVTQPGTTGRFGSKVRGVVRPVAQPAPDRPRRRGAAGDGPGAAHSWAG
ncbi:MAG: sigma-70 family RNA polymerase sigma factor [Micromonosporaceae bacterium]|nr:sigma-70 family RNA polymerase sigma factor [Micromonosporaceae bacterium]